jgi:bacterioferritin-associated ferredoxin
MYICNCNGITESEIRGAVELGCATLKDLQRDLGVASCCGRCVPEASKLLRESEACTEPAGLRAAGD